MNYLIDVIEFYVEHRADKGLDYKEYVENVLSDISDLISEPKLLNYIEREVEKIVNYHYRRTR